MDEGRSNRNAPTAEELVTALCDVDPRAWRQAAMDELHEHGFECAARCMEALADTLDRARLWNLEDDLESALYRLTTHEGVGVIHGSREYQQIRRVTWCATLALASDGRIDAAFRELLTAHFNRLVPSHS